MTDDSNHTDPIDNEDDLTDWPKPLTHREKEQHMDRLMRTGAVTDRDIRFLLYMHQHGFITLPQIYRLGWSEAKTSESARKRMSLHLNQYFLVERYPLSKSDIRKHGLTPGVVYTLADIGRRLLRRLGYQPNRIRPAQIYHDLGMTEIHLCLEEVCHHQRLPWVLTWYGERATSFYKSRRDDKPMLVPDGLAVLQLNHDNQVDTFTFFIEYDASREAHGRPSSAWGRKFVGFDTFFTRWEAHPVVGSLPYFPWVVIITHGDERLQNLAEAVLTHRKKKVGYALVLLDDLKAHSDFLTAPIWALIKPGSDQILGKERDQRQALVTNQEWLKAVRSNRPRRGEQPAWRFGQPDEDEINQAQDSTLVEEVPTPSAKIEPADLPPVPPPNENEINQAQASTLVEEVSIPSAKAEPADLPPIPPVEFVVQVNDDPAGSDQPGVMRISKNQPDLATPPKSVESVSDSGEEPTPREEVLTVPSPVEPDPPSGEIDFDPVQSALHSPLTRPVQPAINPIFQTLSQLGVRSLSFLPHRRTPAEQLLAEIRQRFERDAQAGGKICRWYSPLYQVKQFFHPTVPPAAMLQVQWRTQFMSFLVDLDSPETDWMQKFLLYQQLGNSEWRRLPEFKECGSLFPSTIVLTQELTDVEWLTRQLLRQPRSGWFLLTTLAEFNASSNVIFEPTYVPVLSADKDSQPHHHHRMPLLGPEKK